MDGPTALREHTFPLARIILVILRFRRAGSQPEDGRNRQVGRPIPEEVG
jgi:hypothetical protein